MITAFLLTIYMGGQTMSANTYFYDIDRCSYFAQRLNAQKAPPNKPKQKAVCTLVKVNPDRTVIYR